MVNRQAVRVLLVEDDEDDYVITRDLLGESVHVRFALEWVATYADALDAIRRQVHDVYLVDYRLGAHTGLALLRQAHAYGCIAPLILLTGQDDHDVDGEAIKAGAADYLVKSQISAALLERSIRYAIKRKEDEAALRIRDRAIAAAHNGIIITGLAEDDAPMLYVNPAFERLTGYSAAEVIGRNCRLLQGPDTDRAAVATLHAAVREGRECQVVLKNYRKDGTSFWNAVTLSPVRDAGGCLTHFVGSQTDVSAQKQAEEHLYHTAFHDGLTGLANRALFVNRMELALARARRDPAYTFAVLFLDLDRFKTINDSLGHLDGDHLLVEVARRLGVSLRPADTVARFGGDEFAVLLEDLASAKDGKTVATRIQADLGIPFKMSGHEIVTSASIGIALSSTGYSQPQEMLRDADIALYRAKALGKARAEVFDPLMHEHAMTQLRLEADLRRAIERKELEVYYQPIVDLASGTITRLEALLRWRHPQRGLVAPLDFIPLAEETGLIIPIGEWVLRTACQQLLAWHAAGLHDLSIAVNLSARQFRQPDLGARIAHIFADIGIDPHYVELELTESSVMDDAEAAIQSLQTLKELGVHLALDDFGTGYSSLSYLNRFPLTSIKIDRAFVGAIPGDANSGAIAAATIAMAHSLNLTVVAEGVETDAQLAFLRAHKCDAFQGYLVSRPLPAEALHDLLLPTLAMV